MNLAFVSRPGTQYREMFSAHFSTHTQDLPSTYLLRSSFTFMLLFMCRHDLPACLVPVTFPGRKWPPKSSKLYSQSQLKSGEWFHNSLTHNPFGFSLDAFSMHSWFGERTSFFITDSGFQKFFLKNCLMTATLTWLRLWFMVGFSIHMVLTFLSWLELGQCCQMSLFNVLTH